MTKEQILESKSHDPEMLDYGMVLEAMDEWGEQQAAEAFQSARERLKASNGVIHFDSGDTTPHYPYAFRNYEQYKK